MDKQDFINGVHLIQDNYNTKFSSDKLNSWWNELQGMSKEDYLNAVKKQIATNKYIPKIAEIKGLRDFSQRKDMNLNSSYWYKNLRDWCNEHNEKYFNITNGQELAPFKN